jgi:hypothetical protein
MVPPCRAFEPDDCGTMIEVPVLRIFGPIVLAEDDEHDDDEQDDDDIIVADRAAATTTTIKTKSACLFVH